MTAPAPQQNRGYPFWDWFDGALMALSAVLFTVMAAAGGLLMKRLSNTAVANWVAMGLLYVLWFGALYFLLKTKYDRPFWDSLAWIYPQSGKLISFFAGPLLALLVVRLGVVLQTPQSEMPIQKMIEGRFGLIMFGLFSVILGPVAEELAFRGFYMPLLIRSLGAAPGIILTALPFAILHGPEYAWRWQYIVLIGVAGAAFGAVRWWTGSTLASSIMHSTYNLTFFAALVAARGAQ